LLLAACFLIDCWLCGSRCVSAEPPRKAPEGVGERGKNANGPQPAAPSRPALDSLGDPLPAGARLRLGTARFHPPSGVSDLAIAPDESVIVTVGAQLIVWDAATGKERWRVNAADFGCEYRGAAYGVRALAFANDSSEFFTPGRGNTALIWETGNGNQTVVSIDSAIPLNGNIRSIDVTPDGKTLAVGCAKGLVVCDREGTVSFEVPNLDQRMVDLADDDRLAFFGRFSLGRFSPDGKILAVVTSDQPDEIRLFDAKTGKDLRQIPLAAKLVRLAFSPDGKQIAATERDSAVRLYEVDSGKRAWSQVVELKNPYENYTSAVEFSPDGKTIAAGATDHRIYLFDSSNGEQVGHLTGHAWYPWTLAFTENSKELYSSGWDAAIRHWDVAARKQLALPRGVRASGVVAASPNGQWLAYADDAGAIRLVDADTGVERCTIQVPGASYDSLRFSVDSQRLAGGGSNGDDVHVAVWELPEGNLRHRWDWPKGRDPHSIAESLSFTPDGTRLAANVFRQSSAYVWDLASDRQVVKVPHQQVYGLSFSPDGRALATAGWDSAIRFWAPDTGESQRDVVFEKGAARDDVRMYAVCYAPEGGLLATAHLDGMVRVWQADAMQLRSEFQVDGRFIYGAINFSPDGLWLATGSATGSVELWDPQTGEKVSDVGRHQGHVYTVGFGRDSRTVVSGGSEEGICYVWDLTPAGDGPVKNPVLLWDALAGQQGREAHRASWALSEIPDRAVPLIAEKLSRAKSIVSPDYVTAGLAPEEIRRLERLQRQLADGNPEVERAVTVRRAVSLLAQIGTPDARQLLEDVAARDPAGDLGRIATFALKQIRLP
jgi:WD40 repeat protein